MAQFKGFSYDEYVKPLEHLQKVHNETLADMNNMSSQSDILDYYLDPERDKQSYALYNNFKQEFNKQADDFARNGLTRSNGMNLLKLHRNYNNNVANVLDALKNKKTEEAAQMAAQEKNNGQMVYSSYAHDKSVDDYLRGKMGYREQNLDEVHKFAKNEAAAASGREYTDNIANAVKALGNMYYHVRTQRGFDNRQAYDIINGLMQDAENRLQWNGLDNIDSKDSPLGFIRNMRAELQKRGIENYSNEDQDKIINAFLTGTYEGLKLDITNDFKDTPEMRSKGATRISYGGGNGPQYPDTPFKPQSDEFTIQGEYSFDEGKLDNLIKDFLLPTRTQFDPGYVEEMFESNGGEGNYHICDYDRYILKLKEKYGDDFWQNEERFKRRYYDTLKRIKDAADLDKIPESYFNWGTNVAAELANRKDELKNLTKPTKFNFPYLNYNKADTPIVAKDMINRVFNGSDIYTNVKYNAKTGEFVGKSTEKPETIREELENAKAGDVNMWLGTMPMNGNYFHIIMRIWTGKEYKNYMIPLKSAAHFSGANVTEELYKAYCTNRDIFNALKQKYPEGTETIKDKNDLKLFKESELFMKECYKNHILNTIKESHSDIKDYTRDMNVKPEWVDINGNKIIDKNKK